MMMHGLGDWRTGMGLRDPMQLAKVTMALHNAAAKLGFNITISNDFHALAEARTGARGGKVAPFFDPGVNTGLHERAFWMTAERESGKPCFLQAFRIDFVQPNLADWAPGWHLGLYLRRGELVVPKAALPPANSITQRVSGRVVYHGELWISPKERGHGLLEIMPRLGMFLAMIKWQPDAMWGIVGRSMATRGHVTRIGYRHIERGLLQWDFLPDGGEEFEWIALAERSDLEYLVQETTLISPIKSEFTQL